MGKKRGTKQEIPDPESELAASTEPRVQIKEKYKGGKGRTRRKEAVLKSLKTRNLNRDAALAAEVDAKALVQVCFVVLPSAMHF